MNAQLRRRRPRNEPPARRVQRLAREQINAALASIRGRGVTDEAIHGARKQLKKARASIRLIRAALGEKVYRSENIALRDAARPLSEVRDGKVLLETLDRLEKRNRKAMADIDLARLRRELQQQHQRARRKVLGNSKNLQLARRNLRTVRDRGEHWALRGTGWPVIEAGLEKVYKAGRNALEDADKERSAEALHEWRKQVKYLWHELQLLEPFARDKIGELADQADKLATYLGNEHDLAVLGEKVRAHRKALASTSGQRALLSLIERSRADLQEKALISGARLYGKSPSAFTGRLRRYWGDDTTAL